MRTIQEAKQKAMEYIKLALRLDKEIYRRGMNPYSMLMGASLILLPHRPHCQPYVNLIVAIRRRWEVRDAMRLCLTDRQRFKAGLMDEQQVSRYKWDCEHKRHRADCRRRQDEAWVESLFPAKTPA